MIYHTPSQAPYLSGYYLHPKFVFMYLQSINLKCSEVLRSAQKLREYGSWKRRLFCFNCFFSHFSRLLVYLVVRPVGNITSIKIFAHGGMNFWLIIKVERNYIIIFLCSAVVHRGFVIESLISHANFNGWNTGTVLWCDTSFRFVLSLNKPWKRCCDGVVWISCFSIRIFMIPFRLHRLAKALAFFCQKNGDNETKQPTNNSKRMIDKLLSHL